MDGHIRAVIGRETAVSWDRCSRKGLFTVERIRLTAALLGYRSVLCLDANTLYLYKYKMQQYNYKIYKGKCQYFSVKKSKKAEGKFPRLLLIFVSL